MYHGQGFVQLGAAGNRAGHGEHLVAGRLLGTAGKYQGHRVTAGNAETGRHGGTQQHAVGIRREALKFPGAQQAGQSTEAALLLRVDTLHQGGLDGQVAHQHALQLDKVGRSNHASPSPPSAART